MIIVGKHLFLVSRVIALDLSVVGKHLFFVSKVITSFGIPFISCHQIKSNAVRALGNLSRFVKCSSQPGFHDKIMDKTALSLKTNRPEELPSTSDCKGSNRFSSNSFIPASLGDSRWFERTVQAFISCVTTGNVKVQGIVVLIRPEYFSTCFLIVMILLSSLYLHGQVCSTGSVECLSCIEQCLSK